MPELLEKHRCLLDTTAQHVEPWNKSRGEDLCVGAVCALGERAHYTLCVDHQLCCFSVRALFGACRGVPCNMETILLFSCWKPFPTIPVLSLVLVRAFFPYTDIFLKISFVFVHFECWNLFLYKQGLTNFQFTFLL